MIRPDDESDLWTMDAEEGMGRLAKGGEGFAGEWSETVETQQKGCIWNNYHGKKNQRDRSVGAVVREFMS